MALALLAIGVVALSRGMASLARAENIMFDAENANRLAREKLNEIVAVGDFTQLTGPFDGKYVDFDWTLTQVDTGVTDLNGYRIQVKDRTGKSHRDGWAETMVYAATTATTGGAQ